MTRAASVPALRGQGRKGQGPGAGYQGANVGTPYSVSTPFPKGSRAISGR